MAESVGNLSLTPSAASVDADLMPERRIAIVVFPGCQALDLTGPHEVFAGANQVLRGRHRDDPRYQLLVTALEPGPVRSESGLAVVADHALAAVRPPLDTLLVVGGDGVHDARRDPELVTQVVRLSAGSRRVASVCTGSFVLAAAGLLDGREACTHWARARRLAREFPRVRVDPESLYRRDGAVWTSAGVTAGVDLALALVEDDCGAEVAQTVARWMVMFLRRPGGQSQFAAALWHPASELDAIRAAQDAVLAHPGADHSVPALAAGAGMSLRNFTRVFTRDLGTTPARYVERVRVEAACRLLETTDLTVDVVARRCGLRTAETLRRSFLRTLGVPPTDYRRRFALAG
jgi:transcriptional regulator GlxA family with amidase domain